MAQNDSLNDIVSEDDMALVPISDYGYLYQIYNNLYSYIQNDKGVIALMANLYAESRCSPNRLQGDVSGAPTSISINYTNNVDNLSYTRAQFTTDQKGYGLAQWTTVARKSHYYDYVSVQGVSIGDIQRGLGYLRAELEGVYASEGIDYRSTLTHCQNATNLYDCTDYVLDHFESPRYPNYQQRRNYADSLWTFFFGQPTGDYNIYVTTEGDGTASVNPSTVSTGDTYDLTCTPNTGETLLDIIATETDTGMSVAIPVVTGTQTVPFNSASNLSIRVIFSGTPPTPPPPVHGVTKRNKLPIWMYPQRRV